MSSSTAEPMWFAAPATAPTSTSMHSHHHPSRAPLPTATSTTTTTTTTTEIEDNDTITSSFSNSTAWQRSPVPLDKDEVDNAAVRALAAKLAPALEEADALFAVPAEFRQDDPSTNAKGGANGKNNDDNDSIDEEIDALRFSEQALRQELELASDFSNLFRNTSIFLYGNDQDNHQQPQQGEDDASDSYFYPPPKKQQPQKQQQPIPVPPPRAAAAAIVPRILTSLHEVVTTLSSTTAAVHMTEADVDPHEVESCPEQELQPPFPPPNATAAGSTLTNTMTTTTTITSNSGTALSSPASKKILPLRSPSSVALPAVSSSTVTSASTTTMLPPKTPDPTASLTTSTYTNNSATSTTANTSFMTLNEILIPAVSSSSTTSSASSPHEPQQQQQQQLLLQKQQQQQGAYTQSDHFSHLRLEREEQTWYSLDWTSHLCSNEGSMRGSNNSNAADGSSLIIKELCLTIPDSKLKTLLIGLPDQHTIPAARGNNTSSSAGSIGGSPARTHRYSSSAASSSSVSMNPTPTGSNNNNKVAPQASPGSTPSLCLPVRTIFIRIRGDVLCGAVMDAVLHALLPPPPPTTHMHSFTPTRGEEEMVDCGGENIMMDHHDDEHYGALFASAGGTTAATTPTRATMTTTMTTTGANVNLSTLTNTTNVTNSARPRVHIQKRQGGHLQAIVGGTSLTTVHRRHGRRGPRRLAQESHQDSTEDTGTGTSTTTNMTSPLTSTTTLKTTAPQSYSSEEDLLQSTTKSNPPFFLDVQLCTQKSEHCERMLLVRVFHLHDQEGFRYDLAVEDDDDDDDDENDGEENNEDKNNTSAENNGNGDDIASSSQHNDTVLISQQDVDEATDLQQCLHLREACALIQRVESPRKAKRIRMIPTSNKNSSSPLVTSSRQVMQDIVSDHLLHNYQACPSVNDGGITLPSLNPEDWPVVVASWRWIKSIWEELESRDLSYNTLRTAAFGSFPALPTLDVHYCSQMRRLSREDMIVQLLKSASELEDFARDSEYACANMISLLQPTFETYGIAPPALPKPTPLTAYPLDYCAPQQTCPPWGQLVMEALNRIQAWTKEKQNKCNYNSDSEDDILACIWNPVTLSEEDALQSVEASEKAVRLVLTAFQKQDDEEKGARLARKNMQVMDRLAKMQEHERLSISMLHQAHLTSDKASKAADDFKAKSGGVREVPLLKWSIVVGSATGTCLVTANHILFVTQLIPYIGGSRSSLFKLREVDFIVQEGGTPSLLNPLPTIISVVSRNTGEEVYAFRPSSGGARLKSFLDIVQSIDVGSTTSETSVGVGSEAST